MIFLVLALAISGFVFGIRTLETLVRDEFLSFPMKVGLEIAFFISWFVFSLMEFSLFSLFFLTLVWNLFFLSLSPLLKQYFHKKFFKTVETFLDGVALQLLCGNSFRVACRSSVRCGDAFSQQELAKILDAVFFKQQNTMKLDGTLMKQLKQELESIEEKPHSALHRVQGLRRNLKIQSEFRQKSEQVAVRIRIQSLLMCGIYFGSLAFVSKAPDLTPSTVTIIISVTFFVTGLAWVFIDGRSMKWKT